MAIVIEKRTNLDAPIKVDSLNGVMFTTEAEAHQFIVRCEQEGQELTLAGTITAKFVRADGNTVELIGSISDGAAVVTLAQDCYNVQGRFQLAIFNTVGDTKLCIYACVGYIQKAQAGNLIDSGGIIPDVEDLIADIQAAVESIPPSYTTLLASVAGTYSASKTYSVGEYAWYNGTLYRCSTAISTAEAWTSGHWTAAVLGDDLSSLKSATNAKELVIPALIKDAYIRTNISAGSDVNYTPVSSANYNSFVFDVSEQHGRTIYITGTGGYNGVLWAFADANGKMVSHSAAEITVNNLKVFVPPVADKMIINYIANNPFSFAAGEKLSELEISVENQEDFKKSVRVFGIGSVDLIKGADILTNGSTGSVVNLTPVVAQEYAYGVADVEENSIIIITGKGGYSARLWAFIDNENKILSKADSEITVDDQLLTVPNGAKKIIVNFKLEYPYKLMIDNYTSKMVSKVELQEAFETYEAIGDYYYLPIVNLKNVNRASPSTVNPARVSCESSMMLPITPGKTISIKLPDNIQTEIGFFKNNGSNAGETGYINNGATVVIPDNAVGYKYTFKYKNGSNIDASVVKALVANHDIAFYVVGQDDKISDIVFPQQYLKAVTLSRANGNKDLEENKIPVFMHVTDIHGDYKRLDRAYEFASKTNVVGVLNTGDTVYDSWATNRSSFAEDIDAKYNIPTVVTIGNHDARSLTPAEMEQNIISYYATRWQYTGENAYYYYDFTNWNIRCIVLNDYNTTGGAIGYGQTQINWLLDTLANTPQDYGIILMAHMPCVPLADVTPISEAFFQKSLYNDSLTWHYDATQILPQIIDAFIGKTTINTSFEETVSGTTTTVSVIKDFSNVASGAHFIAHVFGHTHMDVIGYAKNTQYKQLLINETCTNSDYGIYSGGLSHGNTGDIARGFEGNTQDAFNIIAIDQTNKLVKIGRVGSNRTIDGMTRDMMIASYSQEQD